MKLLPLLLIIMSIFLISCTDDPVENNACENITCSDHGKCVVVNEEATCACDTGFHVDKLECLADTVNPCEGQTCSNHGSCFVENNVAKCNCENNYHSDGLTCLENVSNPCEGQDCSGHGTCGVANNQAVCVCLSGYHSDGLTCLKDAANPCDNIDCSGHGTCGVTNEQALCVCENGYHANGATCIIDQNNPCDGETCSNHGNCVILNNDAVCACNNGYHSDGLTCLEDIDPCNNIACSGHGTCGVVNSNPICSCENGYHAEGLTCLVDTVNNPCKDVTCSGHGTCGVANDEAICACDEGYHYVGLTCVKNDPCLNQTCSGHGTCAVAGDDAICACENGYHADGLNCIEDGTNNPCNNIACSGHGTCGVINDNPVCSCDDGYQVNSLNCELIDVCDGITCGDHGACVIFNQTAVCACENGYSSIDMVCVADNICDSVTCNAGETCDPSSGACISAGIKTIKSIRETGVIGTYYTTTGIVVAINGDSFWIQDGTDNFSAIYIYRGGVVSIGDSVKVIGQFADHFGLAELKQISSTEVLTSGNNLPTFKSLASTEFNDASESKLVELTGGPFTVTTLGTAETFWNTTMTDSNGNSFKMRTSIYIYTIAQGQVFTNLKGILSYDHDEFKLLPRSAADMGQNDPCAGVTCSNHGTCDVVGGSATCTCENGYEVNGLNCTKIDLCASVTCNGVDEVCNPLDGNCVVPANKTIKSIRETGVEQVYYTTTGIVTGKVSDSFWIQDGTDNFSAIYIYRGNSAVAEGDSVKITGQYELHFGLAQLKQITSVEILTNGNSLPAFKSLASTLFNDASESKLVELTGSPFTVTIPGTSDNFWNTTMTDSNGNTFKMKTTIYRYTPIQDHVYTTLKGILSYDHDEFKLLPRNFSDMGETVQEATISSVRQTGTLGNIYTVTGVVTGVSGKNFFIQDGTADFSGIYIYRSDITVAIGDSVTVSGEYADYHGLAQLKNTTTIINSNGNTLPAFTTFSGTEENESKLGKFSNAQFTVTVLADDANHKTFTLTDSLGNEIKIKRTMFNFGNLTVGQTFNTIQGVISYDWGEFKIFPTNATDIQ